MDEGEIGGLDDSRAIVVRRVEDDDDTEEGLRNELLQLQRIRGLDMEQLEMEDDNSEASLSLSDNDSRFSPSSKQFIYPLYFLCSLPVLNNQPDHFLDMVVLLAYRFYEVVKSVSWF